MQEASLIVVNLSELLGVDVWTAYVMEEPIFHRARPC